MGKTRKVAGCVPVRIREGKDEYEVLLVKSRWVEGVWLYPKGGVEEHEEAKMSAIRETREEAGVIGRLGPKLGSFKTSTGKEVHKMWILFVEEEFDSNDKRWKERGKRARHWYSLPEAVKIIEGVGEEKFRPELKKMTTKTMKKLDKLRDDGTLNSETFEDDDADEEEEG
uniref:Nudix hydrolase domain-containing protein n=1 Tax=Rhodosorus marinus TaxID=101924 RepID=A0A7S0G0M0_9RHOD|mmetsp:Transcript_11942/g.17286  ORF Transcript_11942/g.17286 Transcript_11942/m.17286 type:complete len:170 (+) Transcript_11942:63-572(+)